MRKWEEISIIILEMMVNLQKKLKLIATTTSIAQLVIFEEVFHGKCLDLWGENRNRNPTSGLSYLSSMVAWIMKHSCTSLTKWKESSIFMRYQTPKRRSWSLSSWEGELQLGGYNSKFKDLEEAKERFKIGPRWSRK